MSKSIQPSFAHVRDLYRLFADVRVMNSDPITQRRMLVDGVVALLDADQGFFSEVSNYFPGRRPVPGVATPGTHVDPPTLMYVNQFHATQIDAVDAMAAEIFDRRRSVDVVTWEDARPHRPAKQYPSFYDLLDTIGVADVIDPVSLDEEDGHAVAISIHRLGHRKPFDAREKALARLAAEELHHLHVRGQLELTPRGDEVDVELTPRQRQILAMLLSARAPKQIALELGLSLHTARDHIKAIYRKLRVGGRDELMTKFIRRNVN